MPSQEGAERRQELVKRVEIAFGSEESGRLPRHTIRDSIAPMKLLARLLLFAVIAIVGVLPTLAHASPPDQTWLGGWFDDSDFDDIVVLVTSTVAALELCPVVLASTPSLVLGFVGGFQARLPISVASSPFQGRAPPPS